jgi:hypothetical protein
MRNRWISFGCFLTGFNYNVLKSCSELAKKKIIRYTSALVIICIIWAFIGYAFTSRYLLGEWYFSVLGMFLMVLLVIQIERQVILATHANVLLYSLRVCIAFVMAIIGSIIIDQIIFKEDIERQKIVMLNEKVNRILPGKGRELREQIHSIDSTILSKEYERTMLVHDISKNPTIPIYSKQVTRQNIDSISSISVTRTTSTIENPKMSLIQPLDDQIAGFYTQKTKIDSMLVSLRNVVEVEVSAHSGFLEELNLMFSILKESNVALGVWLLWFVFLLGIEVFILVSKIGENDTDYDQLMQQQMELHAKRVRLLGQQAEFNALP